MTSNLILGLLAALLAPAIVLLGIGACAVVRRIHSEEYPKQPYHDCHEVPDDYWSTR